MTYFRDPLKYLLLAHPTGSTIPIGTHSWEVGSKSAVCDKAAGALHELTFSTCYPDMYTCNDGSCIGEKEFQSWAANWNSICYAEKSDP